VEGWVAYIKRNNSSFSAGKLYVGPGVAFCESGKFTEIHVRTAWHPARMNPENVFTVTFIWWLYIEQPIKST
jgi:hypothetical protein